MTDEEIDANEASFIDYMTTTEVLYLEGKAEGIKVEKEDIENEYSTLMSSLQQTYNITEDELINKCNITKEDIEKELEKELGGARRSQIGSAGREEKIRTYNFPQDRVTDHRINKSWHDIESIMDGRIEKMISAMGKAQS